MGQAAEALGIDRKTLSRARKAGMPIAKRDGPRVLVDVDEVRDWLREGGFAQGRGRRGSVREALAPGPAARESVEPAAHPSSAPGGIDLDELAAMFEGLDGSVESVLELAHKIEPATLARLEALAKVRKAQADAQRRELDVEEKRGRLLDAQDVERRWLERIRLVGAGLNNLPSKLAARCAQRAPREVEAEAREMVRDLMEQFAEEWPE